MNGVSGRYAKRAIAALISPTLAKGVGSSQPVLSRLSGLQRSRSPGPLRRFRLPGHGQVLPAGSTGPTTESDGAGARGLRQRVFPAAFQLEASIKGWLSQLDRRRFRIFGYHTGVLQDAKTKALAALCDRFVQGPLPIDRWRAEISADAPHVLIYPEVGMHHISAQLAAQRLAPVQCNSWGHPDTSGFPTLDYYLSSELMEPSDAKEHYTERLIRLPNLSIYYEPLDTPVVSLGRTRARAALDGRGILVRPIAFQIFTSIR